MNRHDKLRGMIGALATMTGLTVAGQGCNVFAGLDSVQFEGSGGAGGGVAGNGGTTVTGAAGDGGGGTTSMGGQGGTTAGGGGQAGSTGGTMNTSSSTGGTMTTSGTMTTTSSSSGTGGAGPTLDCGNGKTCSQGSEACCWDHQGTHGPADTGNCVNAANAMDVCDNNATAMGLESIIECQTSDQCPGGQTCCGFVNTAVMPFYQTVKCQTNCPGGGPTIILCSGPGDPVCPAPTTCTTSSLLPSGYYRCFN